MNIFLIVGLSLLGLAAFVIASALIGRWLSSLGAYDLSDLWLGALVVILLLAVTLLIFAVIRAASGCVAPV